MRAPRCFTLVALAGLVVSASSFLPPRAARLQPLLRTPLVTNGEEGERELHWRLSTASSKSLAGRSLPRRALFEQAGSSTLSLISRFTGLSSADAAGEPPDPVIGVGAGSLVEMVNGAVRIWTTEGLAKVTYPLQAFFRAATADVSDPQVVFDPGSGRWFASVVDVTRETVQVAVSETSDPAEPWTVYSHATPSCPDQPTLGVGPTLVAVGYGAFAPGCRTDPPPGYLGGAIFAYSKDQLLAGGSPTATDWEPRPELSPIVAISLSAGSAMAVALGPQAAPGGPPLLSILSASGLPAVASRASMTTTSIPIAPLVMPPMGKQAATPIPINTNDYRLLSATLDGDTLWLAGNDGCVPKGDSILRSCLRIIAVARSTILVDRDIGRKGADLFYPALAPDHHGGIHIVHGYSSPSDYPSLATSALDTRHRLTPSIRIAAGTAPHRSDRYGDYFSAASDGAGDVYVVGETGLHVNDSPNDWGTTVARLRLNQSTTSPSPSTPRPCPHASGPTRTPGSGACRLG
jgi:hypothetical protein